MHVPIRIRSRLTPSAVVCAALLAACGSASSPTATPTAASPAPTSPGRHEVVIGGGDVAVGGILFRPQAAAGRPAIIVLHGWHDDCGLRQPDDVVRAAAWLREQSGVSGDRLAVVGFSQGGQVALLAATRDTRLRAVVAYYPVTDVPRWKTTTTNVDIPGYISAVCEPGGIMARSPLQGAAHGFTATEEAVVRPAVDAFLAARLR